MWRFKCKHLAAILNNRLKENLQEKNLSASS